MPRGELRTEPQCLDVGTGELKYVYFRDPDDQYVCLVEAAY